MLISEVINISKSIIMSALCSFINIVLVKYYTFKWFS